MEPAAGGWLMAAPPTPLCSADIWLTNGASAATEASVINKLVNRSGAAIHQLSFGSAGSRFQPKVNGAEALLWRHHRSSSAASIDLTQTSGLCSGVSWFADELKGNTDENKDRVDNDDSFQTHIRLLICHLWCVFLSVISMWGFIHINDKLMFSSTHSSALSVGSGSGLQQLLSAYLFTSCWPSPSAVCCSAGGFTAFLCDWTTTDTQGAETHLINLNTN